MNVNELKRYLKYGNDLANNPHMQTKEAIKKHEARNNRRLNNKDSILLDLDIHRSKMKHLFSKYLDKKITLFLKSKGFDPSIFISSEIQFDDDSRALGEFPSFIKIRLSNKNSNSPIRVIDISRKGNSYVFTHKSKDYDSRRTFFTINEINKNIKGNNAKKLDNNDADELLKIINNTIHYVIKNFSFKDKNINDIRINNREKNAYRGGRPTQKLYYEDYFPY